MSTWTQTNQKFINDVKRTCVEHELKGGYGGTLPLKSIIHFFDSSVMEINRLQKENEDLKAKK